MKSKTLALLAASAIASTSAFAGDTTYVASKTYVAPEIRTSLYPDHEFTIDLFGTYAFTESTNERILGDHAFGGGLAVNYFFTKYIGLGIEGQALKNQLKSESDDVNGLAALNLFYRHPLGDSGWAPYIYVGGGVLFNTDNASFGDVVSDVGDDIENELDDADSDRRRDRNNDDTLLEGHAGIGVEYRVTRHFGVFTDGRWTVVDDGKNNFPSARAGVRFAF